MMPVTIGQICNAVGNTLFTAAGMVRLENYDQLTEGINAGDTPLLQVYWQSLVMDPDDETDRFSFQGGIRQKLFTIYADVHSRQRGHLAEDNQALTDNVDALLDVLEQQNVKPYFGLDEIQAFKVSSAVRAQFPYAGVTTMGARIILDILVF